MPFFLPLKNLAQRLEPHEAAALICTKDHGPGNAVTRQCVKCASDYRALEMMGWWMFMGSFCKIWE